MITDSFIVRFWSTIFSWLKWISVFQVIRKLNPKLITYRFVDAWVLGNLIFSILSVWVVHYAQSNAVKYVILIYGLVRVFEVIVYQINVLLFDEYRTKDKYQLRSYRRTVLLLLHNFAEIIFWFATSYSVLEGSFNMSDNSVISVIYNSFAVLTSFGTSDLQPVTSIGLCILWGQSIIGLFLTLISLARFVALLPSPKSSDENENQG